MKKILLSFIPFICMCFIITGCGKNSDKDVMKSFSKKISTLESYHLTGKLEIYRGEDSYNYDVDVTFKQDDNYRVSLTNQINNHEQIILRNSSGVYVLTPSLNKSFKFQSDWPYNNSQIYLLQVLLTDLQNDNNKKMTKDKDNYIFEASVNYSTNKNLVSQKIYMNKDLDITKVEVLDNNGNIQMLMSIDNIEYDKKIKDNYFDLNKNLDNGTETEKTSKTIEDIIYPMYVPQNTYLTAQERLDTDSGERVILTFDGDNPFMLVEETVLVDSEANSVIYGDPYLILDTVGAVTDYSVSWISNGVEYYLVSDSLNNEEMLSVAQSISVVPIGK